jgi:hypothetical protein
VKPNFAPDESDIESARYSTQAIFFLVSLENPRRLSWWWLNSGEGKGREVECVAQHRSYDRVVAVCTVRGVSLGGRMRAASVANGGR